MPRKQEKEASPDYSEELESFLQEINKKEEKKSKKSKKVKQIVESLSDEEVEVEASTQPINNKQLLLQKLSDIRLNLPWIETLAITTPLEELDVNNDLQRELAFYSQALTTASQAKELAKKASIPFTRPNDYFAEMVKSDDQMQRIRQNLLDEQQSLKAAEERKKLREAKKFGKQVQVQKTIEKQKMKSMELDKIKSLKRKRKDGALDAEDFDVELDNALNDAPRKKPHLSKRDKKNQQYGFGGKKRGSKSNTRESLDSGTGPSSRQMKKPFGSRGKSGKPKGGKPQRPGKSSRMRKRK